jgi:hypothetical protein
VAALHTPAGGPAAGTRGGKTAKQTETEQTGRYENEKMLPQKNELRVTGDRDARTVDDGSPGTSSTGRPRAGGRNSAQIPRRPDGNETPERRVRERGVTEKRPECYGGELCRSGEARDHTNAGIDVATDPRNASRS